MFLIRLLRWLFGWVRLEGEGGFPERLLNLTAREEIALWNVRRRGETLSACCPARRYRRLRRPARKAGMRLRVKEKHGAPFLIRRYRARSGLAAGLLAFFVVLHLFAQRTWVIEVRGNETVPTEDILTVMEKLGVREGKNLADLDIPTLQLQALHELPDLAWCTVNLKGSIAYVEVTERIPTPELSDADEPSNIKAARDGRIVSIQTYTGQAMVQAGDAVAQGMLLVSGVVESSAGPVFRRSQAKILAETERRLEVRVPLKETLVLPTGEELLRPSLRLFTLEIPLFTDGPIEEQNTLTVTRHMLEAGGIELPVGIVNRRYALMAPVEVVRTQEEAAALAAERLEEKVNKELAAAEITSRQESGRVEDGCYILSGTYACIEDIGVEEQLLIDNQEPEDGREPGDSPK
ncbi:MAG TPA: sporulation protein YqfD [Firmicutes bacterium]|nr:sporulation protein YqfD [Bacillota bacterium]